MEGKSACLCKLLVIGVIVLFIGFGVQPAVAHPDIVDFKTENMEKEEFTIKINEIMEKYGHIPMVSYLSTFILTFIALYITAAVVVVSYILVLGFIFIYILGFIGI